MNNTSYTCLLHSVANGDADSFAMLDAPEIDLDEVGENHLTALIAAVLAARSDWAVHLIRNGAHINLCEEFRGSALHVAAGNGLIHIIKTLVDEGAIIDILSSDGVTPLMMAAAWGNGGAVSTLLRLGADPSLRNTYGSTACEIAGEKGYDEIVSILSMLGQR